MRNFLLLLLLVIVGAQSRAQNNLSREFEVISLSEFDYTYAPDPEAEAIVLFDKGFSHFVTDPTGGFNIEFTRTKRTKINSQAGSDLAEVSLPFYVDGYGKTERITSIEAYTYNLVNGLIEKKELDLNTVYEERLSERLLVKKFAFPDVKKGSVIEYKYTLNTPFHFNLPDWEFQGRLPVVFSEYVVRMIPFYEYVFLAQGISHFSYQNSRLDKGISRSYGGLQFNDMVHTYVMENVPAFKDESFISSINDYLIKIDFQLSGINTLDGAKIDVMTTWEKLNSELNKHENFGKYLKKSEKVAREIFENGYVPKGKNELERARDIINFVKKTFSWTGYYGKYANGPPKTVFEQKSGNIAEINLFLTAMLNVANIKCLPVVLSSRGYGKISADYPFADFFNYVVVLVQTGTQSFLADGAEPLVAFNRVPLRCINDKGLVVNTNVVQWVDVYNKIHSVNNITINLLADPGDLTAEVRVSQQTNEFEAYLLKRQYENDTTEMKAGLIKSTYLSDIQKIETFSYSNNQRPYSIVLEGETELEKVGDKLIVRPLMGFPISENKLTQQSRTYPVDFIYSKSEKYKVNMGLPEGYRLVELPRDFYTDNEMVAIKLEYKVNENNLTLTAEYTFKKAVYQPQEYDKIKRYFDLIVRKFNEDLVFEPTLQTTNQTGGGR